MNENGALHDVVKGFLAAFLHDGKKLLLYRDRQDRRHYGSWGGWEDASRHAHWDTLQEEDVDDLAPWNHQPVPLPVDVMGLIDQATK